MEWIKEHKLLTVFFVVLVLLIIFLFIVIKPLITKNSVSEYGDRLKGIENVKISKKTYDKLKKELSENEKVEKVSTSEEGRLINVIIYLKDVNQDEAKEIGNKVLEYFVDEEKSYYDIQIYLNAEEIEGLPKIGYKHKTSEGIVWN